MNDKFIYIYDVECKQSFIINTQQIVWIDINSQSMMMSASSDKGLFHLDEESTKAIIEVVNKGAKNCCHGDYSKQVGGRYISEDTVIEWLKDQNIIKTSGQEKEARKQLSELPSVTISSADAKTGQWIGVSCYDAFGGDYEAWMAHGDPIAYHYCSECKEECYESEDGKEILSDFCPHCGADMRADREEVSDEEEEDDCTDIYCENCRNNYNCIEYLEEQERMNEEDDE